MMNLFVLLMVFLCPMALYSAEPDAPPTTQAEEPKLYDHYLSLQRMQESLAGRSPEEQARMQPQLQRAERKACERLRKERSEGMPKESYRRQGGDEFLVFSHQFEQYCETLR